MRGKKICSPWRLIKRGFFSIHVHWTWVETYGQFWGVGRGGKFPRMFIKKSIIDLIFYDAQNLLPLFSVRYILNRDISFSFWLVLPFEDKNLRFDILGLYSSQQSHFLLSPEDITFFPIPNVEKVSTFQEIIRQMCLLK